MASLMRACRPRITKYRRAGALRCTIHFPTPLDTVSHSDGAGRGGIAFYQKSLGVPLSDGRAIKQISFWTGWRVHHRNRVLVAYRLELGRVRVIGRSIEKWTSSLVCCESRRDILQKLELRSRSKRSRLRMLQLEYHPTVFNIN